MSLQYVLDNLLDHKQCSECLGVWFLFSHEGKTAYYRLSQIPPASCSVCEPIDEEIEAGCLVSMEQWVTLDEAHL
jgi:hypothetical protein